jgi:uncharacterized membrane protein
MPLRIKLTTGRPKPELTNPAPAIVKLAGRAAISIRFGLMEFTLGVIAVGGVVVVNVAVIVVLAFTFRVHAPVPLQPPPLQPENVEPDAGIAVSVTLVPVV